MNIPVYMIFTAIVCFGSELTSGLAAIGIIIMAIDDLFKKTNKEVKNEIISKERYE